MAEHLTLVSLRRAISAKSGVSEKVADDFLNALFSTIQDGLVRDGIVGIQGLGTFKLQDVPARESVNVATGERFTIDGYRKIVFTEGSSHDVAEAPQTQRSGKKKTEDEPIDPIQKLGEQAEEIKGILSELNAMTSAEAADEATAVQIHQEAAPEVPETPVEVAEAPEVSESAEAPVTPESEPDKPAEAPKKDKQSKPFNAWLTGLITIGVFAMLLIVAYFVLRHQIIRWADNMRDTIEQRITVPAEQTAPQAVPVIPETQESQAVPENQENQDSQEAPQPEQTTAAPEPVLPDYFDDSKRSFSEFQATETVGQDSRLAWVAKKHYGEKALWVFIFEANRDRLRNPNQVRPGMQLRIPKLPAELRDVNNPDTKALLDRLSNKYLD